MVKDLHIEPHLKPTKLMLYKGLNRVVKLFKFVGDVESDEFDSVKSYMYHVTPEFALNEHLIGFNNYTDIGFYCQENDVWVVEEILNVPIELTVGYEQQALKDEKDRRERQYLAYVRKQKENLAQIDEGFMDATYPDRRHDRVRELINSCRVYIPEGRYFFTNNGVMYLIREDGDYMMRVTNSEYDNDLCNTTGVIRGVFCYTKYNARIARLINETCSDETEEFRRMYAHKKPYKGIPYHEPIHVHHKPHEHTHHNHCHKKSHVKDILY